MANPRRNRNRPRATAVYLASNALSLMGNSIAGVVLPLVLLARTGDVLAAGSLALICSVPQFLAGFIGGTALDRADRRLVGAASDLLSALAVGLLPVVDAVWGLSFGWFAALGVLGAFGDVPGMTARDTLMPAACAHDGVDLQRFVGVDQTLNALSSVAGPAAAAVLVGVLGDVDALWATAACSLAGGLALLALPRGLGRAGGVEAGARATAVGDAPRGIVPAIGRGLRVLFAESRLVRASITLSFGVTMVMGAFQGIVLPAFFTASGARELTGVVVAAMGAGLLAGSAAYSALSKRLPPRAWLAVSLAGMAAGVIGLGAFPAPPWMLAFSALTGFFAGPVSALLGFFVYGGIPEDRRGVGMGALNSLYLVVAPAGVFLASASIELLGMAGTGLLLSAVWCVLSVCALAARAFRNIDLERVS